MKTCNKCKRELDESRFSKNKHAKDLLQINCKDCCKEYQDEYRKNSYVKEKNKLRSAEWAKNHKEEKIEYDKRYYRENLEHIKANTRKWNLENKDRVSERNRKRRLENPDLNKTRCREWRSKNLEKSLASNQKWKQNNREKNRGYAKSWRKNNPEKARANAIVGQHRRRARKLNVGGSYTPEEFIKLKEKFDNKCLCCGRSEPEIKLTADHVKPITKGGSNDIYNIQPLCLQCNSRKHTKHIDYRTKDIELYGAEWLSL